ncbi:MAG: hypothetical protein K2X71_06235 [Methylobacterium sp.]|uniref:hypothetical protein n=1 Tax=Methylobacterium sp. TaxID=409 RepID=UPI002590EEB4|nr:hypothetical protein [Methylobacterium sp.]MBY0295623.1 hypothetical protein [Methylobacterium sp.]
MTAPLRSTDHIAHGSAEMLRACAGECLQIVAFYATNGVGYADALDDAGLDFSTRRAVAALRQAVGILAMLKEAKRRDAERRGGEPAAEVLMEPLA